MAEHPMNLSSIYRRSWLDRMTDEELVSVMAEASMLLRQRQRSRGDEFRRTVRRLWSEDGAKTTGARS